MNSTPTPKDTPTRISEMAAVARIATYNKMSPTERAAAAKNPSVVVVAALRVGGNATTLVPPNLIFGGDFDASDSALTEFHNHVHGTADLSRCLALRRLGPDCHFQRHLYAIQSGIQIVECSVNGDADFSNSSLREINRAAHFRGDLIARSTQLQEFHSQVDGLADFQGLKSLTSISSSARFQRLNASNTGITRFDSVVQTTADLSNIPTLKEIGPNARFGLDPKVTGSAIETGMPKEMLNDFLARSASVTKFGCQAIVAVSGDCVWWRTNKLSPSLNGDYSEALKVAAAVNGPMVVRGTIRDIFGGSRFDLEGVMFSNGVSHISAAEQEEALKSVLPYFEAALSEKAEPKAMTVKKAKHLPSATFDEAVKLIQQYNSTGISKPVFVDESGCFTDDGDISKIPPDMVFGAGGEFKLPWLSKFENEVLGDATFTNCSELTEMGPKARFRGGLTAQYSNIEKLDCCVDGYADLSFSPGLREIGANARLKSPPNLIGTSIANELPPAMFDFLRSGKLSVVAHPGEVAVGAANGHLYWVVHPETEATISPASSEAMLMTSQICGPVALSGKIRNGTFAPNHVLYSDGQLQDARSGSIELSKVSPYYKAALSEIEERGISLPIAPPDHGPISASDQAGSHVLIIIPGLLQNG